MEAVPVGTVTTEAPHLRDQEVLPGDAVRLVVEGGRTVLQIVKEMEGDDASGFRHPITASGSLLSHIAWLAKNTKLDFQGVISSMTETSMLITWTVYFPDWLLQDPHGLRPSTACAQLFLHMIPLQNGKSEASRSLSSFEIIRQSAGEDASSIAPAEQEVFSLRSCIMSLPGSGAGLEPTDGDALPPQRIDALRISLAELPDSALYRMLGYLDAHDIQSVAMTCRFFRSIASEVAPGLLLKLFPHQRAAIKWMRKREAFPGPIAQLNVRQFCADGRCFWGDTACGGVRSDPQRQLFDFRGGLLCDEPGLGKTITSLGLILRTKGALPEAPHGAEVTWFQAPDGEVKKYGFYTVAETEANSNSRLQRGASGNNRFTRSTSAGYWEKLKTQTQQETSLQDATLALMGSLPGMAEPRVKRMKIYDTSDGEESNRSEKITVPTPDHPQTGRGMPEATPSSSKRLILTTSSEEQSMSSTEEGNNDSNDNDDEEDSEPVPWLQCDICQKWCRVPPGYTPPGELWCCYQHPNPGWRSCTILGDEPEPDEDVTACPGWVRSGESPGTAENIDYFRNVLADYVGLLSVRSGLSLFAGWLLSRSADSLQSRFAIPNEVAQCCHGFGRFLEEIKFVPVKSKYNTSGPSGKSGDTKQATNLRPFGWCDTPGQRFDWVRWESPPAHWLLRLDLAALAEAIKQGPLKRFHRIFLSPATLVVVPPELVLHWKAQIAQHTRPGALRVAVYDSRSSGNNTVSASTPAHVLAWEYDVVITTFSKMSVDWDPSNPIGCSHLTRVHWLRVILDEGHTIGSLGMTNKLAMALALRAERRWVMTGTPAPSTLAAGTITLRYMQPLLAFLKDEALGTPVAFQEAIDRQLRDCPLASRWRLLSVLRRCMIRASKADLWNLPPLRKKIVALDFSPTHATSYNFFVDIVRFNLLMSDWSDPDHKESLLAAGNATRAAATLRNLQLSCNVAGNIVLQVQNDDLHECLLLVSGSAGKPPPDALAKGAPFCGQGHPLAAVEKGLREGASCGRCGTHVRVIIVTPCACLMCVECTALDKERCACCGKPYAMQAAADPARRADNPKPKWAVPQQLIEFQPAYTQRGATGAGEGAWQPDWQHTDSTKCQYLVSRLREVGALPPPGWNPNNQNDWDLLGTEGTFPSVRWPWAGGHKGIQPAKAIVFSQFWPHLLLLERSLAMAVPDPSIYIAHYRSTKDEKYGKAMTQADKAAELTKFRRDPRCGVLLMDESGALGLDLSLVQHVFLMEPIRDRSVEEQVVSRAHRMGASQEVRVEIVAMKGTYEEAMLRRSGDWPDLAKIGREESKSQGADHEIVGFIGGSSELEGEAGCGAANRVRRGSVSSTERERRRQEAAKRMDRNAFLSELKPVRVKEMVY